MEAQKPVRVLVVDDSALVRKLLSTLLSADPTIDVVATAADPYEAREKIKEFNPDVLTLDVEMPRMDGITFLGHLMRLRPMPVVMVSSLTAGAADATLDALALGAIDFVTKPEVGIADGLTSLVNELRSKIKSAAKARVFPHLAKSDIAEHRKVTSAVRTTEQIIAIGASTGGTEAISQVLRALPSTTPGIVVVQHIQEAFTPRFAQRLDREGELVVREAKDGDQILVGHVYIAPANRHLRVERNGAKYICRLLDEPPFGGHRPSVDILFNSVAKSVASRAMGVILTGMGVDGAAGLLQMREAGASTLGQDEDTSVVWGMPGEAFKRGAVQQVAPISDIAPRILDWVRRDASPIKRWSSS